MIDIETYLEAIKIARYVSDSSRRSQFRECIGSSVVDYSVCHQTEFSSRELELLCQKEICDMESSLGEGHAAIFAPRAGLTSLSASSSFSLEKGAAQVNLPQIY